MTFENFLWFVLCASIVMAEITVLLIMGVAFIKSVSMLIKSIWRLFDAG